MTELLLELTLKLHCYSSTVTGLILVIFLARQHADLPTHDFIGDALNINSEQESENGGGGVRKIWVRSGRRD